MPIDVLAAGLSTDAAILGGTNVVLWVASIFLGKTWPVDFIWSNFPIVLCGRIILGNPGQGVSHRQQLVCVLVALWGYRLTHNFVARGGIGHEDWRYADMRTQFGKHFWWISLFSVFLGQTIFLFAACLSLYPALLRADPLSLVDAIGAGVALGAIALETFADMQMDAFQKRRREEQQLSAASGSSSSSDEVIYEGLWQWSRHPNYLGEIGWWWGIYAFGAPAAPGWVLSGPCLITFLFVGITVQLMEDRQLARKPHAYRAYKRKVPSSLLLLPPPLNRALGEWLHAGGGGGAGATTPAMS